MPIKKITKVDTGFFTNYIDNHCKNDLLEKIKNGFYDSEKFESNEAYEAITKLLPYKIHLSINGESYNEKIINGVAHILLNAIANDVITEFKYIDLRNYLLDQADVSIAEKNIADAREFKKYLFGRTVKIPDDAEDLKDRWKRYKNSFCKKDLNDYYFLIRIISDLEENSKHAKRFKNNSQITIFLPVNLNKKNIFLLLNTITQYLKKQSVQPGELLPTQSKINEYFSLRQDHIRGEYIEALVDDEQTISIFQRLQFFNPLLKFLKKANWETNEKLEEKKFVVRTGKSGEDPYRLDFMDFKKILGSHSLRFPISFFKPEMDSLKKLMQEKINNQQSLSCDEVRDALIRTPSKFNRKLSCLKMFDEPNSNQENKKGTMGVIQKLGRAFNA